MNDLIKLTVDELREIVYDQLPQGYPQPSKEEEALAILARRAQANDALRSVAQWVATAERDLQASALVNDGLFNAKLEQLQERCGDLRAALAAAPAPSSIGAPAPADSQREARLGKDAIAALQWLANENGMAVVFEREIRRGEDPDPCRTMAEAVMDRCRERVKEARRSSPPAPVAPVTDAEVEAAIRAYRSECIAPPEDDACEDEAFGYLRSLIARRVAEARGHGLRELRARLLSTAGSLPNRQMGHSDEDFDRGYVEACENWAQEIDSLLAAPPAGKGGV